MAGQQAGASSSVPKMNSRRVGLQRASLLLLILLIAQFALGISVNLYVTLPKAGHPGHASWFSNGALLGLHAALMAMAFAAALACYTIGQFAAQRRLP